MRRTRLARLSTSLALAILLGACTTGAGAPAPGSTAPSAPPTGAAGLFTGHDTCTSAEGGGVSCVRTASDTRVSGTYTSASVIGSGNDPKIFSQWRVFVMTNSGGAWDCQQFMLGAMDNGTGFVDMVCTGRAGYAGLTSYVHSISASSANDFGVLGWVERS